MCSRRGFTLVELLVALPIMLLILLVVAQVLTNVQEAVSAGAAQTDVMTQVDALERVLRDDVRRISRDGFMVIKNDLPTDAAGMDRNADQWMFFANGPWRSQDTTSTTQANVARIWYGHLAAEGSQNPPAQDAMHWSLGRHQLLITPEPQAGAVPRNIWHRERLAVAKDDSIAGGLRDIAYETGLPGIREQVLVLSSPAPPGLDHRLTANDWDFGEPSDRLGFTCFRVHGKTTVTSNSNNPSDEAMLDEVMLTSSVIASNCMQFKIEFAGDYDDTVSGLDVNAGEPIWYGASNPIGSNDDIEIPSSDLVYTAVFGYDRSLTPWPKLVRITVTLHDPNGRMRDLYENAGGASQDEVSDGREFQFVLRIPD